MQIQTVGFFSDHTSGIGGGEHYAFSLLRALADRYDVELLVRADRFAPDPAAVAAAFGVDITHPRVRVRELRSPHDIRRYDLFVNLSHFTVLPPWARRNLLVVFFPELQSEWVSKYDAVLTISRFSADWIESYWGVSRHAVAQPPIDAGRFAPGVKAPLIVSVGRFFEVKEGNNKNHPLMIRAFRELVAGGLDGWRLALAGSTSDAHAGYLARVRAEAADLPVDILTDIPFEALTDLYGRASIYWHAAGFHADGVTVVPAAAEHFGITILEAMAAGAVPVIADAGGAAEIVDEPRTGLRAGTVEQFIAKTAWLAREADERAAMSGRARAQAAEYSHERFTARVHAVIDTLAADRPAERARLFLDDGNLAAAEACLLDAVDEHPSGADAHFDLADVWYRRGRREAARAMWRRGAEIDPAHPRAARASGLAERIDLQRRHVGEIRSGALFGEDYFERGAEAGLNGYTGYTDDFAPVQADIVSVTFEPSTCLEIGCARGEFVHEMRARGVRAFGTDISVYSVRSAAPATRPGLTAAMISSLPYRDDSFDLVTAVEVFEHVPPEEVDRAIRELWRVTRTFVWITVQNTDAATPEHFFTDLSHVTMKPLAWWQERFRVNGFEVLPFELPFGQFRLHQIVAQPLGKQARRSDADIDALGKAMLDRGEIPQLVNMLDLLDQEARPQPALREALAARTTAA